MTVYILYSLSYDRSYTGQTNNIDQRLARHNEGKVIATKAYRPWKLVAHEEYATRGEAMKRERWLKSGVGRELVKQLVARHKNWNG